MASFPSHSSLNRSGQEQPNQANNSYLLVVRLMAVLFVVTVSLAVGFFISVNVMVYFGGLVFAATAFYLVVRAPWVMFAAFLSASFLYRLPFSLGGLSVLPASYFLIALMTFFWLLEMFVIRRRISIHRHRVMVAALAFAAVSVLAFIAGYLPWFPLPGARINVQLTQLGLFLLSMCAFFLGAHKVDASKHLQLLIWVFLALVGAYILFSQLPAFDRTLFRIFNYGARGSLMWLWAAALAFSQALANRSLKAHWRLVLFGFVGIVFYATLVQSRSWVSGWGPALAAVAVIIWFHFKQYRRWMLFAGAVGLIVLVNSTIWRRLVFENAYSIMTREAANSILLEIVRVNPVLGLGPANYYWYTPLFPILGWYVQFNSHNQYVDIIAQTGILGMIVAIWLFSEVFFAALKEANPSRGGFHYAYALGVLGGVVGMVAAGFLGDWVIPFVYNVGVDGANASLPGWFFLGCLFALKYQARSAGDPADDAA